MSCPFPGMDPFIEGQAWETFHHSLIVALLEAITARVRPRYLVRVEERVYIEHTPGERSSHIRPDVAVLERGGGVAPPTETAATGAGVAVAPVICTLPMPERLREIYLTLRARATQRIVTVIEVLSPANKRAGSDGRRGYLGKREAVLQSDTHLVELDLLRGGQRLPTLEPLKPADYYAFVSRGDHRPYVEVYPWSFPQPLPPVPVPLAGPDPDVVLPLHSLFHAVYDRAGYDYSLEYQRPLDPLLSDADAAWVQQRLHAID